MSRHPAGTVLWADDPTDAHEDDRPVVVLVHDKHPFGGADCTVMCLGTKDHYQYSYQPELKAGTHYTGSITLPETTYVMPWAIYLSSRRESRRLRRE
jgi:hypothetical protein